MSLIDIHWLERREVNLPRDNDWLSPKELARLAELRFPKRRADWLLGRWTAKLAVAAYLGKSQDREALKDIEILAAASGAPEVYLGDNSSTVSISISHRQGVAMCAVGPAASTLGCDLEIIEPRTEAFVRDYFTPEEQVAIDNAAGEEDRRRAVALVWSAKESALKSMRVGLRLDTRSISVRQVDRSIAGTGWNSLQVRTSEGQMLEGWWQQSGTLLRTVVATLRSRIPMRMDTSRSCSVVCR
jgi:4'-phosphopantetheinyl transferase